jgi:hypothetical protein
LRLNECRRLKNGRKREGRGNAWTRDLGRDWAGGEGQSRGKRSGSRRLGHDRTNVRVRNDELPLVKVRIGVHYRALLVETVPRSLSMRGLVELSGPHVDPGRGDPPRAQVIEAVFDAVSIGVNQDGPNQLAASVIAVKAGPELALEFSAGAVDVVSVPPRDLSLRVGSKARRRA